jgi:hypothetical protein
VVVIAIPFVIFVVVTLVSMFSNGSTSKPNDMFSECKRAVAEWADVNVSEVSGRDVSSENFSGKAWDFRGSYPGGDWACGGPAGAAKPGSVMVYPGGVDSDGIPEEIYR